MLTICLVQKMKHVIQNIKFLQITDSREENEMLEILMKCESNVKMFVRATSSLGHIP